jgi:hypothetical protein
VVSTVSPLEGEVPDALSLTPPHASVQQDRQFPFFSRQSTHRWR